MVVRAAHEIKNRLVVKSAAQLLNGNWNSRMIRKNIPRLLINEADRLQRPDDANVGIQHQKNTI